MTAVGAIDQARVREVVEAHDLDWHYREQTGSTNSDALDYHARHRRELVAFAEAQTAGRGRRGRQWLSPHGQNLYCTVGLVKSLPPAQQGLLSIVTGLALCRALQQSCAVGPALKWPNDLLIDGRKLGGILIESKPREGDEAFFAIGFGLNVFLDESTRQSIDRPVTSLHRVAAQAPDRSRILAAAVAEVVASVRAFRAEHVDRLVDEFRRYDAYHDRPVELVTAGARLSGINRGIDASGALRLDTGPGVELHPAGEISLVAR